MICDKCGCPMQWGVYGFSKSSTTHYICRQCGNVRYIMANSRKVTKIPDNIININIVVNGENMIKYEENKYG